MSLKNLAALTVVIQLTALASMCDAAEDVYVPSDAASREILEQTAKERTLRLGGLDLFPRASGTLVYDDNILITHDNEEDDVIWSLEPGLAITAGDVGAYLPGSVTLQQLRSLLYFSLVDNMDKPRRFAGLDYAPEFNFYTHNSHLNNVGHTARFTGGYALSRLALGLDADYVRETAKNNYVGDLLETSRVDASVRARYDFNNLTWLDNQLRFYWFDYDDSEYQGYQELEYQAALNRTLADRLSLGAGLGFGLVFPEATADQIYEQLLVNATYRLTGKLFLKTTLGVEFRQYDSDESDSVNPVLSLAALYQPRSTTTVTLEAHRRDEPSPYGGYNQILLGASLSLRQNIHRHLFVTLAGGYDNVDYRDTGAAAYGDREDDYFNTRLAFEYEFNRHLLGTLFYGWRQSDSSMEDISYNNNLVGAQILWKF